MSGGRTLDRPGARVLPDYPAWIGPMGMALVLAGAAAAWWAAERPGIEGWTGLTLGLVVAGVGSAVATRAFRARRWRERVRRTSGPSWQVDWPWTPGLARETKLARARRMFLAGLVLAVFLAPFHPAVVGDGWPQDGVGWLAAGLLAIADLVTLAVLASGVGLLLQRVRHGGPVVRHDGPPLLLGHDVELTLEGGRLLANRGGAQADLLCVAESHAPGAFAPPEHVVVWRERRAFSTDGSGRAVLHFHLPDDVPGTDLVAAPAHYWELEVRDPGVEYRGVFLLPIYRAPPEVEAALDLDPSSTRH